MAQDVIQYLESVIDARNPRRGLGPVLLRGGLGALAGLYDVGLEAYLAGERVGLWRRERLPIPVVSIGNLAVGGTGKTPMTQMLCRRLAESGKRVAVLSRGHGGEGRGVRVVSDGAEVRLDTVEAGDEPLLLARTLPGVPVLVGKDRRESGREALRRFGLDALVLDDGFQYWQLARDLDIVLLDARLPFDNGRPLPRGLLREPKRHLRRAAMAVATRSDGLSEAERRELRERIAGVAPEIDLYFARHAAAGLVGPDRDEPAPAEGWRGRRIVAVSAIARPESFVRALETECGAIVIRRFDWSDHHRFSPEDVRGVMDAARRDGADAIVMTEKDMVKWPRSAADNVPVYALRIEMRVDDEARFVGAVTGRLFGGE